MTNILELANNLGENETGIFASDPGEPWPLIGKLKKKLKKKLSTSTQETPNQPEELFNPNQPEQNPSNSPNNLLISLQFISWLYKAIKHQSLWWQRLSWA
ncbi:hypothetical protein I8748_16240 [Nostoc sp. CENA67]|uniref:Uncharacterized protein n=1 Tax=Amazonocrinis nigriterrae CENA67 TaxID=2794033 RepID=A0A8J7HQQ9_9NOST|nr:hypothetical protein [Amazonocrinis nigriterrae]MBH8563722.1 hypothetical protein [Amazonocrinis nigriterrae CENA67]